MIVWIWINTCAPKGLHRRFPVACCVTLKLVSPHIGCAMSSYAIYNKGSPSASDANVKSKEAWQYFFQSTASVSPAMKPFAFGLWNLAPLTCCCSLLALVMLNFHWRRMNPAYLYCHWYRWSRLRRQIKLCQRIFRGDGTRTNANDVTNKLCNVYATKQVSSKFLA